MQIARVFICKQKTGVAHASSSVGDVVGETSTVDQVSKSVRLTVSQQTDSRSFIKFWKIRIWQTPYKKLGLSQSINSPPG